MKNIVLKIFSIIILIGLILTPVFVLFSNNETIIEENQTTIISEELTTVSEITSAVVPTIKLYYTFEDKLELIKTYSDKEPQSTTEEVTTVIEVLYTQERTTAKSLTIETYTEEEYDYQESEEIVDDYVNYEDYGGYSAATTVWNYLRSLGYNKAICAGIIGNMMSECGGHTLDLQWWIYDDGFYGICQWYVSYYPAINGTGLYTQLDYLASTIVYEFNTFGFKYYDGFDYEAFLQIDNYYDAAIAFAKCYERCASWTYDSRTTNAAKAYNYFA